MKCVVCGKSFSLAGRCTRRDCPKGDLDMRLDNRYRRAWDDYERGETPDHMRYICGTGLAIIVAIIMLLALNSWAHAMDHGFDHDNAIVKWFDSVQRPDARPARCCGLGDAYEGDEYVRDANGDYLVTITDGSAVLYPDGTHRQPIADGTVVRVPATKINSPTDGNPTGHGVLFITVQDGKVIGTYCFVPMLPGS